MSSHTEFATGTTAELADPQAWRRRWQTLGARAAAETNGSFAVGLTAGDGGGFMAVDRFAMETLCYRMQDGVLRVAPRADALGDAQALDPQAMFEYLYFHVIPSPRTIYAGVQRLPAGHFGTVDQGRLQVTPWWNPRFEERSATASFDELKAEFRVLLRDSVARAMGNARGACFLSGGTDSSTVAGMVREASGRGASTYSIGFDAEGYDEMAYARIAARHFDCEHHEYYVTPDDLVTAIPMVAASYDQPFGNSSALPAYYCALKAREDGHARILAGDGGDELFGGNSRYAKQRVFGWYSGVPQWLRAGVLEPLFSTELAKRTPLVKKGASYVEQARVPMPDRLQMYNLLRRLGVERVLTPHMLAQVNVEGPLAHQRGVWKMPTCGEELNRTLAFDWRYTLAENDLPKVRGTTRLAGIEAAFPLLDERLVDFSLRLPTAYKLRGLKLRWFFKEALRGFLPDEIITKQKHGFGLPFGVWLGRHAGLHKLAAESLASLGTRGLVRQEFIKELMQERVRQHPGYYGEMVWILMMLEQWMQSHAPNYRLVP